MSPIAPADIRPEIHHANYFRVTDATWPRHTISDLELIFVIRGEFSAEDAEHPRTSVRAGDVLLIRGGFPCDFLRCSPPGEAFISCIHFELLEGQRYAAGDYAIGPREPWVVSMRGDWVMVELFRRCAAEGVGYGRYREAMQASIFREIWILLMRQTEESGAPGGGARVREMVAFIQAALPGPVDRQILAREFGLTPEHVNYLFRKELGTTPSRLVRRERCLMAAKILGQGRRTVSQVAAEAGFTDPAHFSRVFRDVMGRPPSAFL